MYGAIRAATGDEALQQAPGRGSKRDGRAARSARGRGLLEELAVIETEKNSQPSSPSGGPVMFGESVGDRERERGGGERGEGGRGGEGGLWLRIPSPPSGADVLAQKNSVSPIFQRAHMDRMLDWQVTACV